MLYSTSKMALRTPSLVHEMAANTTPEADDQDTDCPEKEVDNGQAAPSGSSEVEDETTLDGHAEAGPVEAPWDWNEDPHNPYNWPAGRKAMQVATIACVGFLAQVIPPTATDEAFGMIRTRGRDPNQYSQVHGHLNHIPCH